MTARVVWCREPECATRIFFARSARTGAVVAFEATEQVPFSDAATGANVIIAGKAWRPGDLLEELKGAWEITDDKAREFATGYPWHRRHGHDTEPAAAAGPPVDQPPTEPPTLSEDAQDVADFITTAIGDGPHRLCDDVADTVRRALNVAGLRVMQTASGWVVGHVGIGVPRNPAASDLTALARALVDVPVVREVLIVAPATAPPPPPAIAGRPVVVLHTPT